jgi:uroporphyrinogen-III synthase
MRVVITRPAGDAQAWVDGLQAAGHDALALPLIDVGPAANTEPVLHAWAHWAEWQAVMFVSAQAVRYFFEGQPAATQVEAESAPPARWTNGPRCWATGPGTHKALLQAGVPEACIDSPAPDATQFDSEALWQRVASQVQVGKPVLIVRGLDEAAGLDLPQDKSLMGSGRDWLAQQLEAVGAPAHFVVAYERHPPRWTAEQKDQASQAAADGSVWCFSSSQAIQHLSEALPKQSWTQARCIATHVRIAKTAQNLGFGEVHAARPSLGDVLRSLESLA